MEAAVLLSRPLSFGVLTLLALAIVSVPPPFIVVTAFSKTRQMSALPAPEIHHSGASEFAQLAPSRPSLPIYIIIGSVVPPKATAGSVVTLSYEKVPPSGDKAKEVQVLFDALNAQVVNLTEDGIAVRIPPELTNPHPKISVTGDLRSLYPVTTLEVEQKPFPLAWILIPGLIILVTFLIVLMWTIRDRRSKEKLVSQLDILRYSLDQDEKYQRATGRSRQDPVTVGDSLPQLGRIPVVPPDLAEACARGDCILFAGTGLSAQADLPTWSQFLIQFLSLLDREEQASTWVSLKEHVQRRNFGLVLDILQARGRFERLLDEIRLTFSGPHHLSSELFDFLSAIPISGIVTSALDNAIEESCSAREPLVITPRMPADYAGLLRDRGFFVLKLNGSASDPKSLIFTPQQYSQCLEEIPDLRTFLGSLFTTQTILFMGTSIETIEWFLTSTGIREGGSMRHFAVIPQRRGTELDIERFRNRFNIDLLTFEATAGFREIRRFVGNLAGAVNHIRRSRGGLLASKRSELSSALIERLTLKNIGPFVDAEFHFRSAWTLLLGNNGCGKTTVIRAVALALCGDDEEARRAGHTLLKTSSGNGSIKLSVGAIEYQTTLSKEQERTQVRAGQIGPLKNGTLVALGVPAVRGVSSRSAGLFAEVAPYPRVEDVAPLLRGGLDGRMSNIRQWIISLYARSQDRKVSAHERGRYGKMLKLFFAIIDDMVPGFRIEFDHVDPINGEIYLQTSDGVLPLEYVSQGMSSTIGSAGALIQRMYDIYDKSEHPEREHAVLLIDEIDSHLHPEWQRVLVTKIKEHLPKLQVIATTHSPLLVGNMGEKELIRIVRSADGIEVEHIDQSFTGYRADQKWSRLSEQIFRVDKWSVCHG